MLRRLKLSQIPTPAHSRDAESSQAAPQETQTESAHAWNLCTDAWWGKTVEMGFRKIISLGNSKSLMRTHLCAWGGSEENHR